MMKTYTSAGRLHEVATRLRRAYAAGGLVHQHVIGLFGGQDIHWSRGLYHFQHLIDDVTADLGVLRPDRRQRLEETLQAIGTSVQPGVFNSDSGSIANGHLTETHLDRLEGLHEHLIDVGRAYAVEEAHAAMVSDELDALIVELSEGEPSEIDDFLLSKLRELRLVLRRYVLFGRQGVEDAVSELVGGVIVRQASGVLPKGSPETLRRALRIAKGVMDVMVYGHDAAQALEWSGDLLKLTGAS